MAIGVSRRNWKVRLSVFAVALFVAVGVFAANDWFPKTDALTGKKTGWFGRKLPKNATGSAWNPVAAVLPSPTPQLSKEYVYAGQRLLAVEDANAVSAPPADIAVWRGSNGNWMVMGQTGSQTTTLTWGGSAHGDVPLIGDYDGDGKTDFSVYRAGSQSYFYIWPSGPGSYWGQGWGMTGDKGVAGDFDGDGKTNYVIVRPNSGAGTLTWWVLDSIDWGSYSYAFGIDTDIPAPADYDGDGKADMAVYRSSDQTFYWHESSTGVTQAIDMNVTVSCSTPNLCVVPSDYDGDGKADRALYNSSNASWTIHRSTDGNLSTQTWGNNGTSGCTGSCSALVPVHNDYDLDGKTDLAVWDNASSAVWTIKRSSNGTTRTETFGTTGDIPVPAFYRR